MNSGENIRNALQVLYKTYENIQKLIDYTKLVAQEKTDYCPAVPKTLRWRSDNDPDGWLINDFILLFQNNTDSDCESGNGWKNGPVYGMEISLGEKDNDILPKIYLSKYVYRDINSWSECCSPSNHWIFNWPLWDEGSMEFAEQDGYYTCIPKSNGYAERYWGLLKVICCEIDLMSVNSDNVKSMIFDSFDILKEMG